MIPARSYSYDLVRCVETLKAGGIILYPTDTIWGLGCDAAWADAVAQIIRIKKRNSHQGFIVLVSSDEMLRKYIPSLPAFIPEFIKGFPSPVTMVHPAPTGLSSNVLASDGSAAIRIVRDEFCRELIGSFGKPIVSTSANESGKPFPESFTRIDQAIIAAVNYATGYRREEILAAKPSSIFRYDENGSIFKIR